MSDRTQMAHRIRDLLLLIAGIAGGVWFYYAYPKIHPLSAADAGLGEEKALNIGEHILSELGYSKSGFQTEAFLVKQPKFIDSLQRRMGSKAAVRQLKEGKTENLPVFYWQVRFVRPAAEGEKTGSSRQDGAIVVNEDLLTLQVDLTQKGQWIGLENKNELLPNKLIDRHALAAVFRPDSVSGMRPVFSSISDSLLSRLLYFDFGARGSDKLTNQAAEHEVADGLEQGIAYRYNRSDAEKLGRYYLRQSHWDHIPFKVDSVYIERINSVNVARIDFESSRNTLGYPIDLKVDVAPTGALLGMAPSIVPGPSGPGRSTGEDIWQVAGIAIVLLLGVLLLIIFYRRLKARVIDTKAALILSIGAGMLIPLQNLLFFSKEMAMSQMSTIETLFVFGVLIGGSGAFGMLVFFLLSGVSESVTRHTWPNKLNTYDLIRSGMLFNRPVGQTLVRSMALGLILAGIWTLLLYLLPNAYVSLGSQNLKIFAADRYNLPPLLILFENSWTSLATVMVVFVALGSQIYEWTDKKWLTLSVMALVFSMFPLSAATLKPAYMDFLVPVVIGLGLGLIFIRWDFMTVFLSYFLFRLLIGMSTTSWIPAASPDLLSGYLVLALFAVLSILGFWSMARGKTERSLPRYVPDYVEELAQEERMKQELEIAHRVQQSFLPMRTPRFEALDIAAVCRPAYETGGDYYDVIPLDDHRIAVTIGDVSGKGIQAAFYMTFTKGMLHSLCREVESPARLLSKANRLFYENAPRGTFISLIYGIIDLRDCTFRFARAGHNPILFKKKGEYAVRELQPDGLGLGLTVNQPFDHHIREITLSVQPGDILVLYTDGIVEAQNREHELYGMERLQRVIRENAALNAEALQRKVTEDVSNFIGTARQHDDMTLLVLKVDGQNDKS